MMKSAIQARGLRRTFASRRGEVEAVAGIDLDVASGAIFGAECVQSQSPRRATLAGPGNPWPFRRSPQCPAKRAERFRIEAHRLREAPQQRLAVVDLPTPSGPFSQMITAT